MSVVIAGAFTMLAYVVGIGLGYCMGKALTPPYEPKPTVEQLRSALKSCERRLEVLYGPPPADDS